ncbi:hypothetical protein [Paracidovorax avenae]|uniref:hypothetical protein n=1 Tax=Paracidovorax avenae TaxID=80867 RepID=UPI001AD8418A|nr:hypothetical protein [Paracidovorax avenae]
MAKTNAPLNGIFQPSTMELLRAYALFTEEVDDLHTTLDYLAESLVLAHLEEHERFQDWIASRQKIAVVDRWLKRMGEGFI